jgi:hypothetical protein
MLRGIEEERGLTIKDFISASILTSAIAIEGL